MLPCALYIRGSAYLKRVGYRAPDMHQSLDPTTSVAAQEPKRSNHLGAFASGNVPTGTPLLPKVGPWTLKKAKQKLKNKVYRVYLVFDVF